MHTPLKQHLYKILPLSEEEYAEIISYFQVLTVSKKENLLEEDQYCEKQYFVITGCLRKFFVNSKGNERTTELALESWWITDNHAFEHHVRSQFYIQAIEDSIVLVIGAKAREKLLKEHPLMERYFRVIYQRACAAAERRFRYIDDYSREEYYQKFAEKYPRVVNRIPQKILASFLGFTPEYLSELRRKIRS